MAIFQAVNACSTWLILIAFSSYSLGLVEYTATENMVKQIQLRRSLRDRMHAAKPNSAGLSNEK